MKALEEMDTADVFMQPMMESLRDWCRRTLRKSEGVDDVSFLELGVRRVLRNNESGRDLFQFAKDGLGLGIGRSAFFDLFKSGRRLEILKDVTAGLYSDASRHLDVDTLAAFPQLDGIEVIAGDGHLVEAACHAPRDPEGRKVAPKSLFMLNVRNGLLFPLTAVQGEGRYAHELPAFRRKLPEFLKKIAPGRSLRGVIMLLDMAFNDTEFWSRMKMGKDVNAQMIMPEKSNMEVIRYEEVEFDRDDPVNLGVVSMELVGFKHPDSSTMHRVTYRDPETGTEYTFLTTAMDLPPGLVALLYLLRWRIEKVFDVFKNKLHEKKAWGNGKICQQMQSNFTCLTHNLMLIFLHALKLSYGIEPVKLHRKREKALCKRQEKAAKRGGFINPILKLIRIPSQISCQFIRSLRNAIDLRKRLQEHLPDFKRSLEAYI